MAVLLASKSGRQTLEDGMEQWAARFRLDARDRSLAMEMAYGVLRRLEFIDWRLGFVLKKPLLKLPEAVQMLVRLGAYQLLFLNRIPAPAAVDESVRIAKLYVQKLGRDWSGLVNAVLRNLIRMPEPALPDLTLDPAHHLSLRHSVPLWLCRRWIDRLGLERADAACRACGSIPPMTLRVNRLRTTREDFLHRCRQEGLEAIPTTVSPAGVVVAKCGSVTSLPGFSDGQVYIEDEAAQLIPLLLDPQPGDLVLDACAAPGGKTTHLAELMNNQGRIVAIDRQQVRLGRLEANCRRLGVTVVTAVRGDARRGWDLSHALHRSVDLNARSFTRMEGFVDRILLDAPCSGLGVLRRHPEAKWHKHQGLICRYHRLQSELLESVATVLRPGGVLVYSTCSTEREETEDVVERFCRAHPGWMRESVEPWLPRAALSFVTAQGALSTMGNQVGMDSFYAARLRKVS